MELRLYWQIIKRRLWLVLALLILFGLSYVVYRPQTLPVYQASMRFVVGIAPERSAGQYYTYDRYYTWLTAEYLVDDLSEVIKSQVFARDVATASGLAIPPGAIQGATSAGKLHRILHVTIQWRDPQELDRIANAIPQVLHDRASFYFAQLGTENAVVALIDPPQISAVGSSLRQRLDLPLRLAPTWRRLDCASWGKSRSLVGEHGGGTDARCLSMAGPWQHGQFMDCPQCGIMSCVSDPRGGKRATEGLFANYHQTRLDHPPRCGHHYRQRSRL
jgi:hypothetical protein